MRSGASFVASTLSTRMWRVHKAAGKPWPVMDDDPVIDYQIMEAVATKIANEDAKEMKRLKVEEWKKDKGDLEAYR